tara:strand:- start:536 stop:784 length:249 start_codon:yes stop_codon:yes gene_type:complete
MKSYAIQKTYYDPGSSSQFEIKDNIVVWSDLPCLKAGDVVVDYKDTSDVCIIKTSRKTLFGKLWNYCSRLWKVNEKKERLLN